MVLLLHGRDSYGFIGYRKQQRASAEEQRTDNCGCGDDVFHGISRTISRLSANLCAAPTKSCDGHHMEHVMVVT